MKTKRLAAVLLSAVLSLALLAGCGKTGNTQENPNSTNNPNTTIAPGTMVYVPEYINLPKDLTDINYVSYHDGYFYFASYVKIGERTVEDGSGYYGGKPVPFDRPTMARSSSGTAVAVEVAEATPEPDAEVTEETEIDEDIEMPEYQDVPDSSYTYDVYGYLLFKMKQDGSGYEQLPNYTFPERPEGADENSGDYSVSALKVDASGNLWVAENGYFSSYSEDGGYQDYGSVTIIRKLDNTGAELSRIDLSSLQEESDYFNVYGLELDSAGNVYFTDSNGKVYAYDEAGTQLLKLEIDTTNGWLNNIIMLGDGRVAALAYQDGEQQLLPVDLAARDWGETVKPPANMYSGISGGGEFSLCFNDSMNLVGYNIETGETEKLINWINSDIDGNSISNITVLPDGQIVCFLYNYSMTSDSSIEMAVMKQVDASTLPQKTVLTMACFYLDYSLRAAILDFNKTNSKYRIEVNSYQEYNTDEDYTAGITKLTTEIISGKVPDIIQTNSLPMHIFDSKGLLEDLYPYIDNDPEITRDSLMMDVLAVHENKDGKLKEIASSFGVYTLMGDARHIGAEPGWTFSEMNEILAGMPEGAAAFSPYMSRETIMYLSLIMNISEYLNVDTGECNFNSDGFKNLLTFARDFPKEEDINWEEIYSRDGYQDEMDMIIDGQILATVTNIYNMSSLNYSSSKLGDNIVFKGFPCDSRNGNSFMFDGGLSMTTRCRDKAGAWEFMRIVLGKPYQENNSWSLPTNKELFNQRIEEQFETTEVDDGMGNIFEVPKNGYWYWGPDGSPVVEGALTREMVDKILDLIARTDSVYYYDDNVIDIVNEEADYYFAGQKSVDEVANIIQSRLTIFINEQR